MDKNLIRKEMRKKIAVLDDEQHQLHSAAIQRSLSSWPLWQDSKTIVAFVPSRREPDLMPLLFSAWASGVQVGLVRVPDHNDGTTLEVRRWNGAVSSLESHPKLALSQPADHLPCIDTSAWNAKSEHVVVALVPGLAFTKSGARLGHGQGWYDRFLAAHPGLMRVGVAFDFQIAPTLPIDTWDQPMNYVASEQGILFCRGLNRAGTWSPA